MFSKKSLLTISMLLALSLILFACGGGTSDGGGDDGEEGGGADEQFIQILTGGTEGTYYPLGGTFAQVINDNVESVEEASATSTGASVENMNSISDGDGEIAFTQTDIASYAAEGDVMFDEANEDFGAIGTLYPETIQIVTTQDSGIETVEDLEGKTVSVGAPGSGTYANADNILEIHGLSIDDDIEARDLDFGDSTTGIQDGTIDAAFITSGTPTGAVESLAASVDVNIVSVSEEKAQELMDEYSYYAEDEVPEGTYGLEEAVPTVAVQAMLVAHSDLSEDLVYEITKAIFDNTDAISHAKGSEIDAESALDGVGVDLHPGAQKYFDEEGISEE
ncbi:C4-dicarboxylate ABC transporter substrate-binding protein [Halobacillus andaensis]|uniref:C4-dicarboxylate ABC transporter substrate-binding protein n=1 Tax=Halobacillus andaensis TaxID=1176239 RepID=A0A917B155_HALAA|nr:TAXI family TRAP transporter solute-binding subunit [Halobacillus andaensis]MBP2004187.1 TRAP transporter TAXI family solute receptor [Halobacillus andaensis]GGF16472.1 C4-dicarboxylate ABC transporter substrate-binding protein [Halobacillus andaensis]